jgi:hypothetical protein
MTIVETAEGLAAKHQGHHEFAAQISDETFIFLDVHFDDRKVTGAEIAQAAGAHPVEDYVVLAQLPTWELETVRPTETIDLTKASRFFVIKGDGTERFFADGIALEWPRKVITGEDIKRLAGKDDENVELLLEREAQPDKLIDDDDDVRIGSAGVEKFHTRPAQVNVTIFVNTRATPWTKRKISFEDLVKIAYPTPPPGQQIVYTVTFFDGPPRRPEGSLSAGESVRVREGMAFNVKFTDKS